MPAAAIEQSRPVDVIRGAYEAFNRRDVVGFLAQLHPDIRWYTLDLSIQPCFLRGRRQVGSFVNALLSSAAKFTAEPQEIRVEGDLVLVRICHRSRREPSSPETSFHVVHLWTVRDGQAVKHRFYLAMDKAAKAFNGQALAAPALP